MTERWVKIPWLNYEVSDTGQVRHASTKRVRKLKATWDGYPLLTAVVDGKHTNVYVHRLVCEAFSGPPPSDQHEADHINAVVGDIGPDNLQWLTPEENRAKANVQFGEARPGSKMNVETVRQARKLRAMGWTYTMLCERFGITRGPMWQAVNGETWRRVE